MNDQGDNVTWPSASVAIGDRRIAYRRTGAGLPVVLLHGITDDSACWTRVACAIGGRFEALALDARGHGFSDAAPDDFSLDALTSDVEDVLDALDIRDCILFGHSMGAITALALAARRPGYARALVLEDPPLDPPAPPAGLIELIRGEAAVWLTLPEAERHVRAAAEHPGWDPVETVPWSDAKARVDPAVVGRFDIFARVDWRAMLPLVRCPGLLLTGDPALGAIVTPATAADVVAGWPACQVVRVPKAGHCVHRDRWAEATAPVLAFLEAASGS
jgi:N-formylmaleamate deformylase